MITNLPQFLDGRPFPFDGVDNILTPGMCVQIHYNTTILRRGIVFHSPTMTHQYMWWQTRTRLVSGEIPVCHPLVADIPEVRQAALTIHCVPMFMEFFVSLPFQIKSLLGHGKRQQELRGEAIERRRLLAESAPVSFAPTFTLMEPPCDIPDFARSTTRKTRSDKNVRKGPKKRELSAPPPIPSPPVPPVTTNVVPHPNMVPDPNMQFLLRVFMAIASVPKP